MNTVGRKVRLGFRGDVRVPYAQAGWEDARNGRPFDYRFVDTAPNAAAAQSYEVARYRVMALREADLAVPAWNSTRAVPPAIYAAIALAKSFNRMSREKGGGYWPVGASGWQPAE